MTTYRYEGTSASGAKVEGIIEAFDEQDALAKARENCRILTKVEPVSSGKLNDLMKTDLGAMVSGGKFKPKALSLLCSQLAIELKAGLPLMASLKLVAQNEQDKRLRNLLNEVADDVHAGNSLADSFALRGPSLPDTFIETIRAGEESGKLDECFTRLKDYFENQAAVRGKVTSAMIYPCMLIAVAIAVIFIVMLVAVPVFEDSFASLGNELPGVTQALINISHFMTDHILLILLSVAALVIAAILFKKTNSGKHFYARLALTFPGFDMINRMNAASQFASTLATMLAAGLPLVQAARITASTANNLLISEDISAACEEVVEGNRMADGLKKSRYLPSLLLEMTAVGEETGKLEETLEVASEYYTKEVNTAVQRALGILEPCITTLLALLVVFILLAVYLPIFGMYGSM